MSEEQKKKPGRPAKLKTEVKESKDAPKPVKTELKEGMISKNGMWKISGTKVTYIANQGDEIRWIVEPTEKNVNFLGKTPLLSEDAIALMEK
jgi:hypothetical protein